MSIQCLPAQIAPFKYARQARLLKGVLTLLDMQRLQGVLASDQGQVEIDLEFGQDEQGTRFARGRLQARVEMVCQRCMQVMPVDVSADIQLGFCHRPDKAADIPEGYEPCVVEDETIALAGLIEDELILALPLVASHPEQSCQPWLEKNKAEVAELETTEKRENPFAVLEGFKQQK